MRRQDALYRMIEDSEAWKDYQHRLVQLRDATRRSLELGSVDKHGRAHTKEQRAVLYVVEQLLLFVPQLHKDFQVALEVKQREADLANAPLYGNDTLMDVY